MNSPGTATVRGLTARASPSRRPVSPQSSAATEGERNALPATSEPGNPTFVAIDFETATSRADSACAIGLVRVVDGVLTHRMACPIRPPRKEFTFTRVHGIAWRDVMAAPTFAEIWPELSVLLDGARFLAAHNARFDRAVLDACCRRSGLRVPALPFRCTVQLARRAWGLSPATLPAVCRMLGIPLRHHDAGSDAEACARIVLAAAQEGLRMGESKKPPGTGRPRRRESPDDRVQEDRHRRGS